MRGHIDGYQARAMTLGAIICGFVLPRLFLLSTPRRAQMLFKALACYLLEKSFMQFPEASQEAQIFRHALSQKNESLNCDYETFISNINVLNPKKVILWLKFTMTRMQI